MAGHLEKRIAQLEVDAGVVEPETMRVCVTWYGDGPLPEIPPKRMARPGLPDLLLETKVVRYAELITPGAGQVVVHAHRWSGQEPR
jgi:hypothetical protein